jgi:alkylation response protein AidB-like acyl-CoA dehydrogenase
MEFAFTRDQLLLRDSVRDALARECTPADVRAAWNADDPDVGRRLWAKLGELDVLGLRLSEPSGGVGLSDLELVLVLEETGRAAVPGPIVEHAAVALPLLEELAGAPAVEARAGARERNDEARAGARERNDIDAQLLRRAASGDAVVTVGLHGVPYVHHADRASHLVVQRDDSLYLIERKDAQLRPVRSVDGSRRLFEVDWAPRPECLLARGQAAADAAALAFDRGALASSAQLLGLCRQMLDMSVEYAKTRRQFGRPIGSFQAVKHMLADAYLALEFACPMVYRAAHTLATRGANRALHVSMAKIYAAEAAQRVARNSLQCHGAIGYSFEYDLQLWMKRSWALAAAWGDTHWHRKRAAELVINASLARTGARFNVAREA